MFFPPNVAILLVNSVFKPPLPPAEKPAAPQNQELASCDWYTSSTILQATSDIQGSYQLLPPT